MRPNRGGVKDVVVYAGAAPGAHIPFLAALFAHKIATWVLVDPAAFASNLASVPGVETYRELFTDATAKTLSERFRGKRVMFISDIRRNEKSEEMIAEDMATQYKWTRILSPHRAMLKFRLPYVADGWTAGDAPPPKVTYFKGRLVTQAFAAVSATEARLITNLTLADREYDAADHEKQMFVLNLVERSACAYPHPLRPWRRSLGDASVAPDFWDWNYSYDTMRMLSILTEYVTDRGQIECARLREIAQFMGEGVIFTNNFFGDVTREVWLTAAALSLACFSACGHKNMQAKRLARPDGILSDQNRASRFRRKCRDDLAAILSD